MTVRTCRTATLCLALLGTVASAASHAPSEEYASRFGRAMLHFDLGSFDRAVAGFEAAGELAPDAPVWRIHAARALTLAGDAEAGRALVREALELGYPPSDALAIDPSWAPLVAAAPEVAGPWIEVEAFGPTFTETKRSNTIGPVRVRTEDDALLVLVGDSWHRWDPATCRIEAPAEGGTVGGRRAALREWSVPPLDVPTDASLRARTLDLVGIRGTLDPDPVLWATDGRHLLLFQFLSPLEETEATAEDLLTVVDATGTRVVARLGVDHGALIGPMTLWPPTFSPSGDTLAVSGEFGAPIEVFDTDDWSLRWSIGSRVSRGTSGRCVLRMPSEGRLYASDSTRINEHLCAAYDLRTGSRLFDAGAAGFLSIDGTSDDRVVIGLRPKRSRPLVLLDGRDFSEVLSVGLEPPRRGGIASVSTGRSIACPKAIQASPSPGRSRRSDARRSRRGSSIRCTCGPRSRTPIAPAAASRGRGSPGPGTRYRHSNGSLAVPPSTRSSARTALSLPSSGAVVSSRSTRTPVRRAPRGAATAGGTETRRP
ncbi:MAG: hypothetical protein AAGI22_17650 [Planctomycetota bacterium]